MMIDLTETNTGAIRDTLMQARHQLGGPALGMVLTLVIVTGESTQYDAVRAASQAAREHPCRIIGVITRSPAARSRLDAEIRVGDSSPGETLLLRMHGPVGEHADSVVAPLILTDIPVVTWWPDLAPAIPRPPATSRARCSMPSRLATGRETPISAGPGRHPGGRCSLPRWTSRTPR
jgi:glucose-6-phosphate dehydrogenase assembly protein OpcA